VRLSLAETAIKLVGLTSRQHLPTSKRFLKPKDFAEETLIIHSVLDNMSDVVRISSFRNLQRLQSLP